MKFEQNVLVVNRINIVMGDDLVQKWGEAANANRDQAAYATAIILSRLQRKLTTAMVEENPEATCRPDLLWTDYGSISINGIFVIASGADKEVLNCFEDHDYLNHLETLKRVAEEAGFLMTVDPILADFPFANTDIPDKFK